LPRTIELEPIGRPQSCCVNLSLKPANAEQFFSYRAGSETNPQPGRHVIEHETDRASGKGGGADLQGAPNPVSTFESCACKSVARTKEDMGKIPQIPEGRTGTMPPLFYGKIAHQDRKYKKCSWHEQRCVVPGMVWPLGPAILEESKEDQHHGKVGIVRCVEG
jgi:hypothetical protein